MSENEKKHRVGNGLPRCIGSDADGFERLSSKLGLVNRHHRKALLESDFVREKTRTVRKALSRKRLRPGERDRLLLFALYGDSEFRRDIWASAYERIKTGKNQRPTGVLPTPSLEYYILTSYIQDHDFAEDNGSELDEVFAQWPDLVLQLKAGVPWAGLSAHAWLDVRKKFDGWDTLNDEQRRQTTLVAFALATIVDDERILRAAVRKIPELEIELGDVLNNRDDPDSDDDSAEEDDVLVRWNDLCELLGTLAAKAVGSPPVVDALAEITQIVGELEEIEQPVRERLAFASIERVMSHLNERLEEFEADEVFSWLDDKVHAQLHARWQVAQQSLSPLQVGEELNRLNAGVPVAAEVVRKLAVDLSAGKQRLDTLRTEEPTDFSSHISWEDMFDKQENRIRTLRGEQRQARFALLSQLSPLGKKFEQKPHHHQGSSPTGELPLSTERLTGSVPSTESFSENRTPEPSEQRTVSTELVTNEERQSEQLSEIDVSDVHRRNTVDASPIGQQRIVKDEQIKSDSTPAETLPIPLLADPNRTNSKGDTETQSRATLGLKRMTEALLESPPRIAYAVQVGRLVNFLGLTANEPLVVLLEAALLASHLRLPDASVAVELRHVLERYPTPEQFANGSNRDIYVLLALAGTLRPALLAPQSGALVFLTALKPSERLGAVYRFANAVAEESQKFQGVRIDSTVLKWAGSEAAWEAERKRLSTSAADWQAQALHKTIKYAPATSVWQKWMKPGGLINQLMSLVTTGRRDDDVLVKEIVEKLEDRKVFEEQVRKTDRVEIGRRRGQDIHAGALNQLQAHAREALEFARHHLGLNGSRPSQSDFLSQALAELRYRVQSLAPSALEELHSCTAGDNPILSGAANVAADAVAQFRQLLDPEHVGLDREPDPMELVASGLFGFSSIHIDYDGTPEGDYGRALDTLLATEQPEAFDAALQGCVKAGDFKTAKRLVNWVEREEICDSETFRSSLDDALRRETKMLRKELRETRTRVEVALARGHISDAARSDHDATLVELERHMGESRVLRFDLERVKLQNIVKNIEQGLEAKKTEVEVALEELALSSDNADGNRIQQSIQHGDLVTANELMDRIRSKESTIVEDQSTNRRQVFQEFYPGRLRAIEKALEEARSSSRVVEQIRQGSEFAGMKLQAIPGAQRESASQMLEGWFMLKRIGRLDDRAKQNITALLSGLGFIVRKVTVRRSERNLGEAHVDTDPIHDRERCPVPAFGSFVNGRYRLVFLWGRPTEEDILQHADERSGKQATIVLYLGRLSEARREAYSHMARQRSRTLLVLDELLLVFLCGERGSRMPIFFACAIPFTYVQPYVTTAGLVPPEMFYGREQEMRDIVDPSGSVFIYGGRQLGKTALLRAVERTSHRPKEGSYAVWIDLKGEGIGYDRDVADIWPAIWRVLQKLSVIPSEIREPNPNARGRIDGFIDHLCARFDRSSRHTLLLLLDEADRFLEVDAREADWDVSATVYRESSRLKALMDRTERSIKVVFAGLHNVLRTVEHSNHPLGHFGQPIQVGPLLLDGAWRTAEALVSEPLLASGYRFKHNNLVTRILAQTNYYPSLIQLYGSALIKVMCSGRIRGAPLYGINEVVVDETYQNTSLREMIRSRFHLTLQLDPRYEIIAYSIANECIEHEGLLGRGIDWRQIDDVVRDWWPEGFGDIEPYTDRFRTLLDEMAGLGVLRSIDEIEGRYTLRNANILLLMGTKEEIADNLLRNRELPVEFEREVFRARHPRKPDGPSRSPLTFQQEDLLRAERNGVSIICGVQAAGFLEVISFLKARGAEGTVIELENLIDQRQFEGELKRLHRQRMEGTTIFVVPHSAPWSEKWVQVAATQIRMLRAKGRYMQIVFMADPAHLWQLGCGPERLNRAGLQWISLRPWRERFLRQWMVDVGFSNDLELWEQIARRTGGWQVLLERLYELEQETGNVEDSLERLDRELEEEGTLQQQQRFGFHVLAIHRPLRCLCEIGGEATFEELRELVDEYGIDDDILEKSLEWAEGLHLVRRVGRSAWQMDAVAARCILSGE